MAAVKFNPGRAALPRRQFFAPADETFSVCACMIEAERQLCPTGFEL